LKNVIEKEKKINILYEELLDKIFSKGMIQAETYDVGNERWFEIDTISELKKIESQLIKKPLS